MIPADQAAWNSPLDGAYNNFNMPTIVAGNENDSAWALSEANWGMLKFDFDLSAALEQGNLHPELLTEDLTNIASSSSTTDAAVFGQKLDALDMLFAFDAGAQAPVPQIFEAQPQQRQDQLTPNSLGLYGELSFSPADYTLGGQVCPPPPMAVSPQAIFATEEFQQYALAMSMPMRCQTPPPAMASLNTLAPSPYASTPALSPDSGLSSDSDSDFNTPCPVRISKTPVQFSPIVMQLPIPMPSASASTSTNKSTSALPATPSRKGRARSCGMPKKACTTVRKSRKAASASTTFYNRSQAVAATAAAAAAAAAASSAEDPALAGSLKCYVCGYKQARIQGDRRSFKRHMETHEEFKKYVWKCIGVLQDDGTYAGGCGKSFSRKDALQRHLRSSGGTEHYCVSVTDVPFPANMDC